MKKKYTTAIAIIALTLTSCTTQRWVTSPSTFSKTIGEVSADMAAKGYNAVGETNDTRNEIYVSGISYSEQTGYNTTLQNDVWNYSSYRYQNNEGDHAEIQLKYKSGWDKDGLPFMCDVNVIGCMCNNRNDYAEVCGTGGIADKARNMPLDQNSRFPDNKKTIYAFIGAESLLILLVCTALALP